MSRSNSHQHQGRRSTARLVLLFLVCCLTLAVTACGGNNPAGATQAPGQDNPAAPSASSKVALPAGDAALPPVQGQPLATHVPGPGESIDDTPEATEPAGPTSEATEPIEIVAGATEPPDATPAPTVPPKLAKTGQRTVLQGTALTVTKVDVTAGPDEYKADAGKTFVAVTVTVENLGSDSQIFDASQFEFIGQSGTVYSDLENGVSGSEQFSPDLFDDYTVDAAGKIANKIILVQVDQGDTKGLNMLFHIDDVNAIQVDLGL